MRSGKISSSEGLNFRILPKKLKLPKHLRNFDLFYRDICNLEVLSVKGLDIIETKTMDIALSFFLQQCASTSIKMKI